MATTYPSVKQTFLNPSGTSLLSSPDHAGLHSDVNDTVEAIQDAVGTTAGTNVLKDFVAGNFPARINTSNVLQQALSGTINNSTFGTPAITGGTANNQIIGTPRITGGTASAFLLGTSQITGGTASNVLYSGGTANGMTLGTPVINTWNTWQSIPALTYLGADSPTFTATTASDLTGIISPGMRLKLTQTTDKYFIVTAINTGTLTMYGGTDYTLANATITNPQISSSKIPFGFPADPTKWMVRVVDTTRPAQSTPTGGTWYNLGTITISIPIGIWDVSYQVLAHGADTTATIVDCVVTLSTSGTTSSDSQMQAHTSYSDNSSQNRTIDTSLTKRKIVSTAVKTAYFLNAKSDNTIDEIAFEGSTTATIIEAKSAYL
jgi:hypothetical protein